MINDVLTTKATYKKPITELGANLLDKIERNGIKAKVQFRIESNSSNKFEVFFIGVRDKKELIDIIDFFCFYDKKITLKHISAKEQENDFYLLTVNEHTTI